MTQPETTQPKTTQPETTQPEPEPAQPQAFRERHRSQMFINDLHIDCAPTGDGTEMAGVAGAGELVRSPGAATIRPAVLATVADVVAGFPACRTTLPRLALTLDIAVQTIGAPTSDVMDVEARLVKVGRTTIASEVEFSDPTSGAPIARSFLTFIASPRPQDAAPPLEGTMRTSGSLEVPIAEHVGARVVAPGVAEIDHEPWVVQNSGTLQGGIVALLAELAAESLTARPVLDLDIRYLAAVRTGPGRAVATRLREDLVRVEVRDAGGGNRLAALATARVG